MNEFLTSALTKKYVTVSQSKYKNQIYNTPLLFHKIDCVDHTESRKHKRIEQSGIMTRNKKSFYTRQP